MRALDKCEIDANIKVSIDLDNRMTKPYSWLAKKIGMPTTTLCSKKNNNTYWSQDDLDKINKVLGTNFKI